MTPGSRRAAATSWTLALASFPAFLAAAQDRDVTVVPDEPTCPACTIESETILRVGASEGPGSLPGAPFDVVVDSNGRFWFAFFRHPLLVFDAEGQFLREVGRLGEGPGELANPSLLTAIGDSVAVFEHARRRLTVFGPDFEFVRTLQLPVRSFEVAAFDWPRSVLLNAESGTPSGVGLPFHRVDLSGSEPVARVLGSFGPDPEGDTRPLARPPQYRQRLARPRDGTVWAADYGRYRLTRWDEQGRPLEMLLRQPDWFAGEGYGLRGSPDSEPEPSVVGLSIDGSGLLWVFSQVAVPEWREVWAAVIDRMGPLPSGDVSGDHFPHPRDLYGVIVEIVDVNQHRVVTRHTFDQIETGLFTRILPGQRAVLYSEPGLIPQIKIISLDLVTDPEGR